MATLKTLNQKYTQYNNDSFNVWMQKTNSVSVEHGDLNNLSATLKTEISSTALKTGTVGATEDFYVLTGSGTTFTSDVSVGDIIQITTATPTVIERKVVQINSDTELLVEIKFPETFSGLSYENITIINLVSAINHIYDAEARRVLIRSIAMS